MRSSVKNLQSSVVKCRKMKNSRMMLIGVDRSCWLTMPEDEERSGEGNTHTHTHTHTHAHTHRIIFSRFTYYYYYHYQFSKFYQPRSSAINWHQHVFFVLETQKRLIVVDDHIIITIVIFHFINLCKLQ